jgi:hypothetical protein
MTDTPNDDKPGFVAGQPEHCHACCRLIHPGQIYYLTIEHEVLCADCALSEGVIRVREDLVVEVKRDRLVIQRGKAELGRLGDADENLLRHFSEYLDTMNGVVERVYEKLNDGDIDEAIQLKRDFEAQITPSFRRSKEMFERMSDSITGVAAAQYWQCRGPLER